jgi:ABC-type polysaccharide/polyol phosphate transport system ATPase subunit
MSDVVIRFDSVSKHYRLRRGWSLAVRDEAIRLARRLWRGESSVPDRFWALRDVSFEITRGETIGLIGANGAGKSTILKILSRVSVPSAGSLWVRGKVGALIEIGAGFHPELTGRENVYLNGTIMGMRRGEIDRKFDSIVAFAEVEKFLDVPIKYYSSGMEMRLGFAVAAHIDPDILLVDEVLAVGDAAFQAKCLNKLAELREQDKTVILVSHVLPNVLKHSDRVLWIDRGAVRALGEPDETVEAYLGAVHGQALPDRDEAPLDTAIRIAGVSVRGPRGTVPGTIEHGTAATIEIAYETRRLVNDPVISVTFSDANGQHLGGLTTRLDGVKIDSALERGVARLILSPVVLTRGAYSVTAAIYDERIQRALDFRPGAATFMVDGPSVASREVSGHVVYPHRWEIVEGPDQ